MDHTLDQHLSSLNGLCRCCGNVTLTQKQKSSSHKPGLCKDLSNDIFLIFDIDTSSDQDDQHSKFICRNCLCTIKNAKKTQSQAFITTARNKKRNSADLWCSFDAKLTINDCSVCQRRQDQKSCCLKRKKKGKNPFSSDKAKVCIKPVKSDISKLLEGLDHEFECELPETDTEPKNPEVAYVLSTNQVLKPTMIDSSTSPQKTSEICSTPAKSVTVDDSTSPLKSPKNFTPFKAKLSEMSTSPMIKSFEVITNTLNKSEDEPLTSLEEQLTTSLLKRKLKSNPTEKTIRCKTRGQPLYLTKVTKPRKSIKKVANLTKYRRAKAIDLIRQNVTGSSTEDNDAQLAYEIKTRPIKRRLDLTENLGVKKQSCSY